ncbi:MAG: hypothetical protein AMXMBFR23_21350 [Chloroflexota bacterium]
MSDDAPGTAAHEHTEDCRAYFQAWLRYHLVASDVSGRYDADATGNAVRERAMFERQLRALGCSPEALLAEWRQSEAEVDADG